MPSGYVDFTLGVLLLGLIAVSLYRTAATFGESSDLAAAEHRLVLVHNALSAAYHEALPAGTVGGFPGFVGQFHADWPAGVSRAERLAERLGVLEPGVAWVDLRGWDPDRAAGEVWVFLFEGCTAEQKRVCGPAVEDHVASAGFTAAGRAWCVSLVGRTGGDRGGRVVLGGWWDSRPWDGEAGRLAARVREVTVDAGGGRAAAEAEVVWPQPAGCLAPHAGTVQAGVLVLGGAGDPAALTAGLRRW